MLRGKVARDEVKEKRAAETQAAAQTRVQPSKSEEDTGGEAAFEPQGMLVKENSARPRLSLKTESQQEKPAQQGSNPRAEQPSQLQQSQPPQPQPQQQSRADENEASQSPMRVPLYKLRSSIRSSGANEIASQLSQIPQNRRNTMGPAARGSEATQGSLHSTPDFVAPPQGSRRHSTGTSFISAQSRNGHVPPENAADSDEGSSTNSSSASASSSPAPLGSQRAMATSTQAIMHSELSQLAALLRMSKENSNQASEDSEASISELEALHQEYRVWRSESDRLSIMAEDLQKQLHTRATGSPRRALRGHGIPKTWR